MDTLLFIVSKILTFLLQPSSLCVLTIAAGLGLIGFARRPVVGVRLSLFGLAALLIAGLTPLANVVLLPLESRFPRPSLEDMGPVRGMIILGGFEDMTAERGAGLGLNEAAERVTEAARLARLMTGLRVVFTGGAAGLLRDDPAQGRQVARWLGDMGIAPARILLEERSRNTWENATETRRLLGPAASGRWLLVTSAAHMPRSIGVFRQAGFDVVAFPVDFRTAGWSAAVRGFDSLGAGLRRLDDGSREWIGLLSYWLLGRSSALFPGP
jgi:uncharacterized SAM-binding protein YcdF (DUF218 family)